jgi:poly(A) polymerase
MTNRSDAGQRHSYHDSVDALRRLAEWTKRTPYEGRLWLVGGALRDAQLGLPISPDLDVVTDKDAVELANWLWERRFVAGPPVVYPRFGTAQITVCGQSVELVTARTESYAEDSRKPEVKAGTLIDDAYRRDFTVNTLIQNLHTLELLDPLGRALIDLEKRILVTPREPSLTFHDDPLRILRAIRFRWKYNFCYAEELRESLEQQAYRLRVVSEERIRDEFAKILELESASDALAEMMELQVLPHFMPELSLMVGCEQGRYHHLDVWQHSLLVIHHLRGESTVLKLAGLLHDVGKPSTRFVDEKGDTRFFNHENIGASITQLILQRMRYPSKLIDQVVGLVKNHMRLSSAIKFTPSAARRLIRDLGQDVELLFRLVEADMKSLKPGVKTMNLEDIRELVRTTSLETPREVLESPLSGDEIMHLTGLGPGPEVGELKRSIQEQVLEGNIAPGDRNAASEFLLQKRKRV